MGDKLEDTEHVLVEDGPSSVSDHTSFVDYVAPPSPKVKPPPKYKSWIVILVLVYLVNWAVSLSGFRPWLDNTFHLSPNTGTFIQLCLVVSTLLYAGLDVVMFLVGIKINGNWVGLSTWMANRSRVQWVHEYRNVYAESLSIVITVLEDGFSMFDAPPPVQNKDSQNKTPSQFESSDSTCKVLLKIEYKVKIDQLDQYQAWRKELVRAMDLSSRPGLLNVEHSSFSDEGTGQSPTSELHRSYLTFSNIDYLNEYMLSPVRERLIRRLRPLLLSDLVQVVQQDAFAALASQQGQGSPSRAPPKWKTWWITVLALYLTILFLNSTTPFYFDQWGLDNAHVRARALVSTIFTTFLSSYVATPFLTMIFTRWMQAPRAVLATHEPWRTLDEGFQSIFMKIFVVVVAYGACIISFLVRRYS